MLIRKLVYFTALYAVLVALLLGPSWEDGKKMAEAASGDIVAWRTSTAEKVRITNASPVPALIPASPRGMDVGTTSYPVRNVKCVNLTMVGTYGSDNIDVVNNLTVGNNIVTAGNVVSTGPINTTKTVTVGNLVSSGTVNGTALTGTLTATVGNLVTTGAGNVGHATANNLTATNASLTRVAYGSGVINATNYTISTTPNATYFVTNTNAQNITLPDPAAIPTNMPITIVDTAGQAGTNTIAVNSTAGNVGGAAFVNISTNYGAKTYRSNGTNWFAQ